MEDTMSIEEARVAIGYTMVSSVMHDLKHGRIRADQNGGIIASSVRARIRNRDANAERTALFMRESQTLTPAEKKKLLGPRTPVPPL